MTGERLRFVIDASVGIKLFVAEPGSDAVHNLFARLAGTPPADLFVPGLFYIECANILLKYMCRFGRSLADSQADLRDLNSLALKSTPTAILMEDALRLAHSLNLTAYDACYAVLGQKLDVPLVTANAQVVKAVDWAVWYEDALS